MTTIEPDLLRECVAEVRLAPSVHNIQPTRWRSVVDGICLFGDAARRLPVADPTGRDVMISHGIAIEALDLALHARGLALADVRTHAGAQPDGAGLIPIATAAVVTAREGPSKTYPSLERRASWRGMFKPTSPAIDAGLARLAQTCPDLLLVTAREAIDAIAALNDEASLHFLRDPAHRAELLDWMRLSTSDPRYHRDGLSREAMGLGAVEAWGAGLVLGRTFAALDRIGLAAPLLSECGKTRSAAAIAILHRPAGDTPLACGRAFYRAWLAIDEACLAACPMSVVADWDVARARLLERHPLPPERQLVNVLRIGVPAGKPVGARARLPVAELIV